MTNVIYGWSLSVSLFLKEKKDYQDMIFQKDLEMFYCLYKVSNHETNIKYCS